MGIEYAQIPQIGEWRESSASFMQALWCGQCQCLDDLKSLTQNVLAKAAATGIFIPNKENIT